MAKAGVRAECRRVAQCLRHGYKQRLILLTIRNSDQAGAGLPLPLDDGIGIVNGRFVLRVLPYVLLDAVARELMRVKLVTGRHRRRARERPILIDEVPAAAHDRQQCFKRGIARGLVERESAGIALAPIHVVEQAARFDEFVDHLAFAVRQTRGSEGHLDVLPFREPARNIPILGRKTVRMQAGTEKKHRAAKPGNPLRRHHH